ncbi:MAG: KEOPS complex subunit Cgi121 [Candidatus Hodarchaeales archaeon]
MQKAENYIIDIIGFELGKVIGKEELLEEIRLFAEKFGYHAITVMNPAVFPSSEICKSAAWHATNAFKMGNNISSNLSVEILLYLSCQRQIKQALNDFGVPDNVIEIVIIAIRSEMNSLSDLEEFLVSKWGVNVKQKEFTRADGERALKIASLYGMDEFNEKQVLSKIACFAMEFNTLKQ